jgi:AcrR family transcriptional regulator
MTMESLEEAPDRRMAGRPRCDRTMQAILAAAYAILAEKGMAGFSIEGVAQRAGSAKTTIYRWWPSKGALAVEAFFQAMGPLLPLPRSDAGAPLDELRDQLRALASALNSPVGVILSDLIAEGQRSPDIQAALIEGYLTPRRALMRQILERGIAAGQVRADIDLSVTLDALFGAIAGRALMWGRPLDLAWVDRLADTVFRGILVDQALGPAGPVAASA